MTMRPAARASRMLRSDRITLLKLVVAGTTMRVRRGISGVSVGNLALFADVVQRQNISFPS